jgi:hypothetical protein
VTETNVFELSQPGTISDPLVGLIDGVRESAQSWRERLLDLKRRGLTIAPELAIADGALGFWKAIEEVWPKTRGQRCWASQASWRRWRHARGGGGMRAKPQDRQRAQQAAQEPAIKSQARAPRHLDG